MAQLPSLGSVHVDRPLTNVSIAMIQDNTNFIADKVFPVVPVSKKSDEYYTYDRSYWNRDEATERGPATESTGNGYAISTGTYSTRVYAFHKDVADQIRANADPQINLEQEATRYVTQKLLLKREVLFASNYMAGSVWTRDYDGVSGAPGANQVRQWDVSSSTPIEDVWAAKDDVTKLTGFEPNTLVLGSLTVLKALINHSTILDRVKYGQTPNKPAMIDLSELAALFKVERVLVMRAIKNSAQEGATASHGYIGGKTALLCYSAPSPSLMQPSAGYIFSWSGGDGYIGAGPAGNRISRFRMEHLRADRIEGEMAIDPKLVSADLGAFWDAVVG